MKLRDQAYDAFVRLLLERSLHPGQLVTQRELVELTGQPLGAVREMIPRLEADRLVRALAQRGLQVVSVDLRLVREAFQLREIVETAAIATFVRSATDDAIATLRRPHAAVMRGVHGGVSPRLLAEAAADWGFHDTIVAAMGNSLLSELHRVNVIRIRVIMGDRATLNVEALPPALFEHEAIIAAIEQRDEAAALAALRAHLASARGRALGLDVIDTESQREPRRPARLRRKA
jgi:DNA-binding GntR family transcriptional regulator